MWLAGWGSMFMSFSKCSMMCKCEPKSSMDDLLLDNHWVDLHLAWMSFLFISFSWLLIAHRVHPARSGACRNPGVGLHEREPDRWMSSDPPSEPG